MRSAIFLLFFYHSAAVFSQTTADAIVVAKQIDSLILVSRTLAKQGDFDKALEVNAAAEKQPSTNSAGSRRPTGVVV